MKPNVKILMSGALIGALSFLVFQFSGCAVNVEKEKVNVKAASVSKEKHSCCSDEEGSEEYSENSIYQLESEWTNQSGKEVELEDFEGKPVVLTMFFASCTYACPVLVSDMKKIESEADNKDYRYVLVSIDPERDTPEKLKEFASRYNLDLKRWTLLHGDKDAVQELAAVLGFKFKKDGEGGYSHSNLINILNEKGEVVYQHTGLNQDITLAADKLKNIIF